MNIGIIGLGLMGGSIAKALNAHHTLIGYDLNPDAIDYAKNHHIIHQGYTKLAPFFDEVEVVYLCLYPQTLVSFIRDHYHEIPKTIVLIEISGIKSELIRRIKKIPYEFDLIFTHPIAGREKIGVSASTASIFTHANYVICPMDYNQNEHLDLADQLAREMGFSHISYLSPEKHDTIIAYTSKLTHVLSLALVHSDDQSFDTANFIGDSYRDLTRIAMINTTLWSDLFLHNKQHLLDKIEAFKASLTQFEEAIKNDDEKELIQLMEAAKANRMSLEKEVNE